MLLHNPAEAWLQHGSMCNTAVLLEKHTGCSISSSQLVCSPGKHLSLFTQRSPGQPHKWKGLSWWSKPPEEIEQTARWSAEYPAGAIPANTGMLCPHWVQATWARSTQTRCWDKWSRYISWWIGLWNAKPSPPDCQDFTDSWLVPCEGIGHAWPHPWRAPKQKLRQHGSQVLNMCKVDGVCAQTSTWCLCTGLKAGLHLQPARTLRAAQPEWTPPAQKLQRDAPDAHLDRRTLPWQQSKHCSYKSKQPLKHLSVQWEISHFSDCYCFLFFLIFKLKALRY